MAAALVFDEALHRYALADGRELLGVTHTLDDAGLVDKTWWTDDARTRGAYVHAAIVLHHDHDLDLDGLDDVLRPYVTAYLAFLEESRFTVTHLEERVFSEQLRCAGTLDLRGAFPGERATVTNIVDVKTGVLPPHVGYQTAAYAVLLGRDGPPLKRRFALNLRGDGTYRLHALASPHDECVFRAALTVAQAQRGWLR
jgi:hypothetical protein